MTLSSPNVAIARRMVEAFNSRDIAGFIADLDAGVELYPLRAQLEGRPRIGHEGAREMLTEIDDDWDSLRIQADEFRDAGDEVVILCHLRARGRVSGVDLHAPVGLLARFREGKAVYLRTLSQQAEALRAAGLE